MAEKNGFNDFYTMGSEVIITIVDDIGHDHEEIGVVWVRTHQYIITSNGRVITATSELKIKATGTKFPVFSVSNDAVREYKKIQDTGRFQNFETHPE